MGYVYSDAEMLLATQVAYMDLPSQSNSYKNLTLGQLYAMAENPDYAGSADISVFKSKIEEIQKMAQDNNVTGWESWKVVDVRDQNSTDGMYGCLIDTGDGNAIVGYRGSESGDAATTFRDWIGADAGLLNSVETSQQKSAEDYMKYIYGKYGDRYDSFSLSGHSLGGNLAEHVALNASPEIAARIDHCTNMDGPGFSDEYLAAHAGSISRNKGLVTHFRWSAIGMLLLDPLGLEVVDVKADSSRSGVTHELFGTGISAPDAFNKHDTRNVLVNPDGSLTQGDVGITETTIGLLTRYWDLTDSFKLLSTLLMGINLLATFVVNGPELIRQVEENLKSAKEWLQIHIGSQAGGNYQVQPDSIDRCRQELEKNAKTYESCIEEIDTLRSSISYESSTAVVYKEKLWRQGKSLEAEVRKLRKYAEALGDVAEHYRQTDRQVKGLYTPLASVGGR